MCDPLTIAGAALQAGSMFANNAAANEAARARSAALSAERARQRVLDEEARGVNEQARGRYEDVPKQQEERTAELAELFAGESNRGADLIAATLPRTNSNITMSNDERERGRATDFANQQGESLARLRSFSDLFGSIDRGVARDGSEVGMIGGFKRGSQGVLPFELEAASMRGQGMRTLGDALGLFGGLGMQAGLRGPGVTAPRLY